MCGNEMAGCMYEGWSKALSHLAIHQNLNSSKWIMTKIFVVPNCCDFIIPNIICRLWKCCQEEDRKECLIFGNLTEEDWKTVTSSYQVANGRRVRRNHFLSSVLKFILQRSKNVFGLYYCCSSCQETYLPIICCGKQVMTTRTCWLRGWRPKASARHAAPTPTQSRVISFIISFQMTMANSFQSLKTCLPCS